MRVFVKCLTAAVLGLVLASLLGAQPAQARELRQGGKLLLTGGVSTVEGAAGGGLATWALIAGNETDAGIGGSAHATLVALPDFDLKSIGGAIGFHNRIELSYAHQRFDTRQAGAALGLGRNFTFGQDVFGAKLRVIGDAVYDQDRILPQIAIGVQYHRAEKAPVIAAVGGRHAQGTDFLVSATKVVLARSLVLDATLRFTKANQFGLLGFGGDKSNAYHAAFEGSAGLLVSPRLLLGAEIRTKPDNLGFAREQKAVDAFAAWQFQRHLAVTAAYVDLGSIATVKRQRGAFLSLQASF
ncbi:DUF3034 family protein [Sphingomonas glacialis]|uniref:DUF3034 family protein n=1 Tax=Sphingomonas glacialis TaxID=658225 RepID=UPI001476D07B|nr:DUF3034 family protein [Sphingomonas glacialis]